MSGLTIDNLSSDCRFEPAACVGMSKCQKIAIVATCLMGVACTTYAAYYGDKQRTKECQVKQINIPEYCDSGMILPTMAGVALTIVATTCCCMPIYSAGRWVVKNAYSCITHTVNSVLNDLNRGYIAAGEAYPG